MDTRECCALGCERPPGFVIQDEDVTDPYAGTESCDGHLGELVRTDVPSRVIPITED